MTRWLSWLSELQPEMFCEVSPQLAAEKGLRNGDWATISTLRGEIEARVLVTDRIPPLRVRKRLIHQIGLPYHFAAIGLVKGDPANELISFVGDPNVSIQESKCLTGNIESGRRSRGRRVVTSGPLLPPLTPDEEVPRDKEPVRQRPVGRHGLRATRSEESEEA